MQRSKSGENTNNRFSAMLFGKIIGRNLLKEGNRTSIICTGSSACGTPPHCIQLKQCIKLSMKRFMTALTFTRLNKHNVVHTTKCITNNDRPFCCTVTNNVVLRANEKTTFRRQRPTSDKQRCTPRQRKNNVACTK